ncbi:hypothetical protein CICLE_v10022852mg [Citrus x clementina]|uniref:Uncharacterized protein n=1 Tax=Citrus clementina TaxID=85681 RepID=V4U2A5_CITCL|nr:hypothetical protein CICLE_v10022852mg [Citrus x clementina]
MTKYVFIDDSHGTLSSSSMIKRQSSIGWLHRSFNILCTYGRSTIIGVSHLPDEKPTAASFKNFKCSNVAVTSSHFCSVKLIDLKSESNCPSSKNASLKPIAVAKYLKCPQGSGTRLSQQMALCTSPSN